MARKILVEVSARHIHLSQKHLEKLFGKNYKLKKLKDLTLPGEFAAKEKVEIKNKNGKNKLFLRIIGPARKNTQVELSITDAINLEIKPTIRVSGKILHTPGAILKGPKGKVILKRGVIIAQRHIHCTKEDAKRLKLKNTASVKIKGKRELIFNKIKVRKNNNYKLVMHIDTDEGNAAGVNKKTKGIIL